MLISVNFFDISVPKKVQHHPIGYRSYAKILTEQKLEGSWKYISEWHNDKND